jgi:DUF971 family protein
MTPQNTPTKLNLKRDEKLDIVWQDGHVSTYKLAYLRTHCPCASCKVQREELAQRHEGEPAPAKRGGLSLMVLPGNFAEPLRVESAELVGNYALRLDWSDQHGAGIYSFEYLRSISKDSSQPNPT